MVDHGHLQSEELVQSILVGSCLAALKIPVAGSWDFHFTGAHLNVGVPWRLLDDASIRLGSCDHGQKFGLPEPVNAISVVMELLAGKKVESIAIGTKTSDLRIEFQGSLVLEIFNHSAGWEGWNVTGENGNQVIALGGGERAIFRH